MSAEFTMSANAHHPRLKTIFVHDDGQLSIVLGGEKYAHVSLITTYAEWRQLVRDVHQEMARQYTSTELQNDQRQCDRHGGKWGDDQTCPQCTDVNGVARLEHLRSRLRAENISYGELAELQSLADHIQPGDVELAEAAGIDEQEFAERGADYEEWECGRCGADNEKTLDGRQLPCRDCGYVVGDPLEVEK